MKTFLDGNKSTDTSTGNSKHFTSSIVVDTTTERGEETFIQVSAIDKNKRKTLFKSRNDELHVRMKNCISVLESVTKNEDCSTINQKWCDATESSGEGLSFDEERTFEFIRLSTLTICDGELNIAKTSIEQGKLFDFELSVDM